MRLVDRAGVEQLQLVPVKRGVIKLVGKDGTGKTNLKRSFKRMKFDSKQSSTGAIEVEILLQHEGSSEWTSLEEGSVQGIATTFVKQMAETAAARHAHAALFPTNTHDKKLERQLKDLLSGVHLLPPRAIIQVCDHGGQENLLASFAQFVASNFIYIMTFDVSQPLEAAAHSLVRSTVEGELQCSPVKLHRMKYNVDWINYHLSAISVSSVSTDGSVSQGIGPVFGCASPPVIFAATHADKIVGREAEVMKSQDAALKRVLHNKQFTHHVYRRPTRTQSKLFQSELCFCIDNTISHPPKVKSDQQESDENSEDEDEDSVVQRRQSSEDSDKVVQPRQVTGDSDDDDDDEEDYNNDDYDDDNNEDPEVVQLRELVTSKLEKHCTTYLTPVTWLLLEDKVYDIRKWSGKKIVSFENIVTIGREHCSMKSRSEVSDALSYLHNFSVVVHFATCPTLQHVVFIDASWVYTTLSRLNPVRVSDLPAIHHPALDKLHKEGIMSQQLANHLLPNITTEERTRMLQAAELLDIATSREGKCEDDVVAATEQHVVEYFVPSALQVDDEVHDVIKGGVASPIPLVLRPDNVGMFIEVLFFRLVNRCIRQFPLAPPYLRRNHAIFHMKNGCDIDLLYVYQYLIVMVTENPELSYEEVRQSCVATRTFIIESLQDVKQQGLAGFEFSVCFQHLKSADEKFLPIDSKRLLSLNKYEETQFLFDTVNKSVRLTAEQKKFVDVWFHTASASAAGGGLDPRTGTGEGGNDSIPPQSMTGLPTKADAKPSARQIVDVAGDVSGIWETFAAVLHPELFTPNAVKVIKKENVGNEFTQSRAMLIKWCDSEDTQATCRMLIQALCSRHIGYKTQAVTVFGRELVGFVIQHQQE